MFAAAVGLALQGLHRADLRIDFIKSNPTKKAISNFIVVVKKIKWWSFLKISVAIFVVVLLTFGIGRFAFIATRDKNFLTDKVVYLRQCVDGLFSNRSKSQNPLTKWMYIKADTARNLLATQNTFSQLFIRIAESLPEGISISSADANFDYKNKKASIILFGLTPNENILQGLISKLASTNWFTSIEPDILADVDLRNSQEKETRKFYLKLSIDLEK